MYVFYSKVFPSNCVPASDKNCDGLNTSSNTCDGSSMTWMECLKQVNS